MGVVNSVVTVPTSLDKGFFKYWFEFLKPFHRLTEREIDVIAALVKERYELSKVITDPVVLDKVTMSEDTKKKVRSECNISQAHFQVIMTKLKKSKVIENGRINPKFIPTMEKDSSSYQLLICFDLK